MSRKPTIGNRIGIGEINLKLIVGLNNPEERFNKTRHNVGAAVVDSIITGQEQKRFLGRVIGPVVFEGVNTVFLKPSTYMNDSGKSVVEAVKEYDLQPKDVLVISDDVALPFGKIRLRASGSSGRHKGLDSIFACLGTSDIPRLKIGVGLKPKEYTLRDWVLGEFSEQEWTDVPLICRAAKEAVTVWLTRGIEVAMTEANCFDLQKTKENN